MQKFKVFFYNFWTILPPLIAITVAAHINKNYALGIFFSVWNGESTGIIYWVGIVGIGLHKAILIAILCGNYDLFAWFWFANHCDWFAKKIQKKLDGFEENKFRFLRQISKIYRYGEKTAQGWLQSKTYERLRENKNFYSALPVLGFVPGFIWIGIAISKFFGLNQKKSFVLMALGNCLKMIMFGTFGWTLWMLAKTFFGLIYFCR